MQHPSPVNRLKTNKSQTIKSVTFRVRFDIRRNSFSASIALCAIFAIQLYMRALRLPGIGSIFLLAHFAELVHVSKQKENDKTKWDETYGHCVCVCTMHEHGMVQMTKWHSFTTTCVPDRILEIPCLDGRALQPETVEKANWKHRRKEYQSFRIVMQVFAPAQPAVTFVISNATKWNSSMCPCKSGQHNIFNLQWERRK